MVLHMSLPCTAEGLPFVVSVCICTVASDECYRFVYLCLCTVLTGNLHFMFQETAQNAVFKHSIFHLLVFSPQTSVTL